MIPDSVMVDCEPINLAKSYRLCTKAFLANGNDGYSCFVGCRWLVNEDDGARLSIIVQNHFRSVSHITGQCKLKYRHHQSIISRLVRKTLSRNAIAKEDEDRVAGDDEADVRGRWRKAQVAVAFARHLSIDEAEANEAQFALAPKVEQRIKIVGGGAE